MRLLGIDPGLASTGIAVIEQRGEVWRLLEAHEAHTASSQSLPARLRKIHSLVFEAIQTYRPAALSIESVFTARNVRSAILMAHGRGAAILAASLSDIPVFEYSPLEIKQSVVGHGRASKDQVMNMVKVLLGLPELPASDHQADAMACALAHVYRSRLKAEIQSQTAQNPAEFPPDQDAAAVKRILEQRRGRRRR